MTDQASVAGASAPAVPAPLPVTDEIVGVVGDDTPTIGGARRSGNVATTSWADDTIKAYDFDLYKGRKNMTDRIGILVPNEITYGRVHFAEGAGYFICHSEWKLVGGQEICTRVAPCCEKLEAPGKRFACLVAHYNTNPQGALVQPFSYQLKLWRFSDAKYVELREMNKEFPLADHDIKVLCTDDQYQKMTLQVCRDKVVNTDPFKKKYGPEVDQWIQMARARLSGAVARHYTPQELLEKLGMAQAPAVVQQTAAVEDIRDLLSD